MLSTKQTNVITDTSSYLKADENELINKFINLLLTSCVCIVFMIVGPALILMNKYIMQDLNFPYPMFLSWMGIYTSGVFAQLLVRLGN